MLSSSQSNNAIRSQASVDLLFNPLLGFEEATVNDTKAFLSCERRKVVDRCDSCETMDESSSCESKEIKVDVSTRKKTKKRVRFNLDDDVVLIPSHRDYSDEEHSNIWSSTEEVKRNFNRCSEEFLYENRDWRNVLEEHEMYYDESKGESIHPVFVLSEESFQVLEDREKLRSLAIYEERLRVLRDVQMQEEMRKMKERMLRRKKEKMAKKTKTKRVTKKRQVSAEELICSYRHSQQQCVASLTRTMDT